MSFAAFVITYRRADRLSDTLEALLSQTQPPARILVVDNGGDAETRQVAEAAGPGVAYHPMHCNMGPAGGAAVGLRLLVAEGFEWIYWGDDDDPPWSGNLLERLLSLAARDGDPGTLGGVAATGVHWDWRSGSARRVADRELSGPVEVDAVGGDGQLLLRRAAVSEVGLPDDRLFWGHEDWEYCLRIRRAGLRLLADGDEMLVRRRASGRAGYGPRRSAVPWMDPKRFPRDYYSTRNYVFMMRSTFGRPDLATWHSGRTVVRMLASWRRGPRFAVAFSRWQIKALWDGYRGRMGRTVKLDGSKAEPADREA